MVKIGFLAWFVCAWLHPDWTQFRGPNSDGKAPEVSTPLIWSETENVVWKKTIPGLGWSSPVVVDGTVYLTTAVPVDSKLVLRVLALDTTTGKEVWNREIASLPDVPSIHVKNSHASPTPIVHEGVLYVHFGNQGTACLNRTDGTVRWKTRIDYPPVHGSGGSPALVDGKLIIVCDGSRDPFVVALDSATGKEVWRRARSVKARISHSFVTVSIAEVDGKKQVMAPGPDHFAAYDVQTGEEIWKVMADGWSVVPQPLVAHGMVIYNHDYDNPELMAVRLGGTGDVTDSHVVWRIKRGAPSTPSPLLVGEELYFVSDNGLASCVDVNTGDSHWIERLGGNYSASPVFVNGAILFLDEDGKATWIRPGQSFEVLQKNEISGRTLATPAFVGDAMYLRTDEHLYKIAH